MLRFLGATITMLLITVVWGATFPLSKLVLAILPPIYYLGVRYTITTIIMVIFFLPRLKKNVKNHFLKALPLGIILFLAYLVQTLGVQITTASKAGFFTAVSVVLVPLMLLITEGKFPPKSLSLGVLLAFGGLVLMTEISLSRFNFNRGDFLVLLCAFGFAYHIIQVSRLKEDVDPFTVATIQFATVALFSFISAPFLEQLPQFNLIPGKIWLIILFLSLFGTAFAYTAQIIAQKEMTAGQAAMILTFEPVFSAIFSYFILHEHQSLGAVFGGILIVLGLLISQFYPLLEEKMMKP